MAELLIGMPTNSYDFHDQGALIERLGRGLTRRQQEVVFLIGSPLSAPSVPGGVGVPNVEGVIDLIRREFDDDQLTLFDQTISGSMADRYQKAFHFLLGRRGQHTVNEIIRNAIFKAWSGPPRAIAHGPSADEECRAAELDFRQWQLAPGIEALGRLISSYPESFGRNALTTNFDPLLEVSIRRADGIYYRTSLHGDGNLAQTEGSGCHVIHLHGYWYGSDTLHTPRQLTQPRPRLRASLATLLRNKLVIACGYGGWEDVFIEALIDVVSDDAASPEILWTFYSQTPQIQDRLSSRLAPGIDRGRITLYSGIDCNNFFPELYKTWQGLQSPLEHCISSTSNPVRVGAEMVEQIITKQILTTVLEGDDEDRPPVTEFLVGRGSELELLNVTTSSAIFVTGIGGQGKSTLAAKYYMDCYAKASRFSLFVWRDCKEERETFENELATLIEKLSNGRVNGNDLAQQSVESIIELLLQYISTTEALFVFDNIDNYVDIDKQRLTGSANLFVEALIESSVRSQVIFTCRPSVDYGTSNSLSIRLRGIELSPASSLFEARGSTPDHIDLLDAHRLTDGHAFWLDLLAIQTARGQQLRHLIQEIDNGSGPLPERTLNSIWSTLKEREQAVLRLMAETVKPETEIEIAGYFSGRFNFNKVGSALRALRVRNLIVVKRGPKGADLLELHPLVRTFIRKSFPQPERASFIEPIIRVYKHRIGQFKHRLAERPPLSVLKYWTQNAELDLARGDVKDAFAVLNEVAVAFLNSAYPRELVRVTRQLFSGDGWTRLYRQADGFEGVLNSHIRTLSQLGATAEVDDLLTQYEQSIPHRDARYIKYCEFRAYSLWFRSAFSEAVAWGRKGQALLESSDVDSELANGISHMLALSERDAGYPDIALTTFLEGRRLSEVIDPEELDEQRPEHHYGNIGRCLHFMGQIESALICYQKSAILIERNSSSENAMNKGYVRLWIGELLMAREEFDLAYAFLRSAFLLWKEVSPPKAAMAGKSINDIDNHPAGYKQAPDGQVEKMCVRWIVGGDVGR